jgi:hypothetical protein
VALCSIGSDVAGVAEGSSSMSTNLAQEAYTQTLQHLVAHGRGPHYTELAEILRVPVEEARGAQVAAAEAGVGCWMSPGTDYVGSWAPFSNTPAQSLTVSRSGTGNEGLNRWRSAGSSLAERYASTTAAWTVPIRLRCDSGTTRSSRSHRRRRWVTCSTRTVSGASYPCRSTESE